MHATHPPTPQNFSQWSKEYNAYTYQREEILDTLQLYIDMTQDGVISQAPSRPTSTVMEVNQTSSSNLVWSSQFSGVKLWSSQFSGVKFVWIRGILLHQQCPVYLQGILNIFQDTMERKVNMERKMDNLALGVRTNSPQFSINISVSPESSPEPDEAETPKYGTETCNHYCMYHSLSSSIPPSLPQKWQTIIEWSNKSRLTGYSRLYRSRNICSLVYMPQTHTYIKLTQPAYIITIQTVLFQFPTVSMYIFTPQPHRAVLSPNIFNTSNSFL